MDVSDQRSALSAELGEPLGKINEEFFCLRAIGDSIDTHIDHSCAGTDVIRSDHGGASHGGDDDVGTENRCRQIAGLRMADGDCGIRVYQEQRHGLAYNIAAAYNYSVSTFQRNSAAAQKFHHSCGGTWDQSWAACD
jgi:hypothetical protein